MHGHHLSLHSVDARDGIIRRNCERRLELDNAVNDKIYNVNVNKPDAKPVYAEVCEYKLNLWKVPSMFSDVRQLQKASSCCFSL